MWPFLDACADCSPASSHKGMGSGGLKPHLVTSFNYSPKVSVSECSHKGEIRASISESGGTEFSP